MQVMSAECERIVWFRVILRDEYGVENTVRVRRGLDIDAGCGQLKAEVVENK